MLSARIFPHHSGGGFSGQGKPDAGAGKTFEFVINP
jgi:hypothetical protein